MLEVTQGYWKWYHLKAWVWSPIRYWPSIVTMVVSLTISEIFSVKEWPDLEAWVWGRSRSLKMPPFDRSHMTLYWSAIVTIALSATVLKQLGCRDLEVYVRGHSRSLEMAPIAHDFLLAFRCNYVSILYRFWDIQCWRWNLGERSLKVIENGTIWKLGYGFLFTFHSNCDTILAI